MNWDAIGVIAEVVAAAGVIITLIYLALQIRQSTIAANASSHHQLLVSQSSANRCIIDNAEVCDLIDRANKDFKSVTDAELIRLEFVMYEHFNQWWFAFATGQKSLLEGEMRESITRGYKQVVQNSPVFREMWGKCGSVYDPKFRDHVDEALATVREATSVMESSADDQ